MNPSHESAMASSNGGLDEHAVMLELDRRIADTVYQVLKASGYGQLMSLEVHCHQGRVRLEGCVSSYYLKQVAQSALNSVEGVSGIDNAVTVICAK